MKIKYLLPLLALMILAGCKKDDEDKLPDNYITFSGTTYELVRGYLIDGKVYIMSEGLTVTGVEQTTKNPIYNGTGYLLAIYGINTISGEWTGNHDFANVSGEVFINFNPALNKFDYSSLLQGGKGPFNVVMTGTSFSLDANGTLPDDKPLAVKFSGTLVELTK